MNADQTAFQRACIQRIGEVFSGHHLDAPSFVRGEGYANWYWGTFLLDGREHRIEVYPDIVVMHQGDRYFECYMDEEWKSEGALIQGFIARLDRYLSGGPWAGPDEKGLPDFIKEKVRKVVRRITGGSSDDD